MLRYLQYSSAALSCFPLRQTSKTVRLFSQTTTTLLLSSTTTMSSPRPAPARIEVGEVGGMKDLDMKEIPFPNPDSESKILLSRVGGQYHANSSKCTHYGAPLVKGVLTGDGRLVCPWHGACFKVGSGAIEDAPGLDSLQSFKVETEGSKVYVYPSDDPTKTCAPGERYQKPEAKQTTDETGVLIIGGGAGAAHTVEALREQGYHGSIKVVSSENYLPIDRTKLSKALITDEKNIALRSADFYKNLDVEFLIGTEAKSVDFDSNQVTLSNGNVEKYNAVIVALGATPNRIPVEGHDLENIFVMRTVEDAKKIDSALGSETSEKKNVVVIGSSFIGMEAALAMSKRAHVTVVGMEEAPFQAILGKDVGNGIRKFHEKQGTKFYLPGSLSHFSSKPGSSEVGFVHLKDDQKTKIPADFVVLGVGVKPATEILKASGVKLEKDGSVKVDEYLRIQGKSNAFAIGDIATHPFRGKSIRVEHWNVAANHGRNVADTIAGWAAPGDYSEVAKPFQKTAVFWSAQGQQLRYCGSQESKEWEDVHIVGNTDDLKFIAYYIKGDKIVAVASMQNDPVVAHCAELFSLERMPSASDIKNGGNPLDVKL